MKACAAVRTYAVRTLAPIPSANDIAVAVSIDSFFHSSLMQTFSSMPKNAIGAFSIELRVFRPLINGCENAIFGHFHRPKQIKPSRRPGAGTIDEGLYDSEEHRA